MAKNKKSEGVMMSPEMPAVPPGIGELYGIDVHKHAKGLKNMKIGKKFKAIIHGEKTEHRYNMGKHTVSVRIHKMKLHEAGESAAEEKSEHKTGAEQKDE